MNFTLSPLISVDISQKVYELKNHHKAIEEVYIDSAANQCFDLSDDAIILAYA